MYKFEVTIKSILNNDDEILSKLNNFTHLSKKEVKKRISHGLPIYTRNLLSYEELFLGYSDFDGFYTKYDEIGELISIFQEKNIDAVIELDNKKYSLIEFVAFRNKKTIHRLFKKILIYTNPAISPIKKVYRKIKESRMRIRMRIGEFNGLPIYFCFLTRQNAFYENYELQLGSIPEWKSTSGKIGISYSFLLFPKYLKNFVLWHEYGHHILNLRPISYYEGEKLDEKIYKINEALAEFYACCKYKLHFNSWREMRFHNISNRQKNRLINQGLILHIYNKNENHCKIFEQRYNNIEEKDMTLEDFIYQFYRDKEKLLIYYKDEFKERGYGKEFNWSDFLDEIGWGKNEDRWKYINFNDREIDDVLMSPTVC